MNRKRKNPEITLTEIQNDDSYIAWITPSINHGDWPFHFIVKVEYMEQHGEKAVKDLGKYYGSLLAVSTVAGEKELEDVAKSMGETLTEFKALPVEKQHLMLAEYGVCAHLFQKGGNNFAKIEKALKDELETENMLFGFYMDRFQNAIGATGWDCIKGDIVPQRDAH